MQARVAAAGGVDAEAVAAQRLLEAVADVLPLAHPAVGDEALLAVAAHRGARERMRGVVVAAPEQEDAVEVRGLVAERRVRLPRLLLPLGGAQERVLAGERGDDRERIAQRALRVGLVEHPRERGLERELGQLPSEFRDPEEGMLNAEC